MQNKKQTKARAKGEVALSGNKAIKNKKQIKLQLGNEQCLMVGGYHSKKINYSSKRIKSYSRDIKPCHSCFFIF